MTWMLTATGTAFDLQFIRHDTIDLLDIAHHLAQINRYTGAASRPYSVAEHSLLACEILERERGVRDPLVLQACLMHDAHEAYIGDISSPLKQMLRLVVGDALKAFEARVQRHVLHRFDLMIPYINAERDIHWADMTALVTERKQLLPERGPLWQAESTHEAVDWADLASQARFDWQDWRRAFVDRFGELTYAAQLLARPIPSA